MGEHEEHQPTIRLNTRIEKSRKGKNLETKLIKWLNWLDKSRLIGIIPSKHKCGYIISMLFRFSWCGKSVISVLWVLWRAKNWTSVYFGMIKN